MHTQEYTCMMCDELFLIYPLNLEFFLHTIFLHTNPCVALCYNNQKCCVLGKDHTLFSNPPALIYIYLVYLCVTYLNVCIQIYWFYPRFGRLVGSNAYVCVCILVCNTRATQCYKDIEQWARVSMYECWKYPFLFQYDSRCCYSTVYILAQLHVYIYVCCTCAHSNSTLWFQQSFPLCSYVTIRVYKHTHVHTNERQRCVFCACLFPLFIIQCFVRF